MYHTILYRSLILLLIFAFSNSFAQNIEKYHRVKVNANAEEMNLLAAAGVCIDHGEMRYGRFLINEFSDSELAVIQTLGLEYEVQIEDLRNYIENRKISNSPDKDKYRMNGYCFGDELDYENPEYFRFGNFSEGYYFYEELIDIMDSMRLLFPNLISLRQPVNDTLNTFEGRSLYYMKISDNPDVDESEPEVLYTSLHHAREPMSAVQLIYFMWYLLENYDNDPQIAYLINNSEMYFVPCVNPDGYIHDQTIAPNGGGFWRKNRKVTSPYDFGIDLNRNYGYNWGYDDTGSSPNLNSAVYRGDAPFSEAETSILKYFCESKNFQLALNYHSYGNLLITPYGYDFDVLTEDSVLYRKFAKVMTKENCYAAGTVNEVLSYIANGNSDDWMYGEQTTKNKIFSFTPEVGIVDYGFYPPQIALENMVKSTVKQNIETTHLALNYLDVTVDEFIFLTEGNIYVNLISERIGLQNGSYQVSIVPKNASILSVGNSINYSNLNLLDPQIDSVLITLDPTLDPGDNIVFDVEIDNGFYIRSERIVKTYLPDPIMIFNDEANNPDINTTGSWDLTSEDFYSWPESYTDSPNGNMINGENQMFFNDTIDLTEANLAFLQFRTKYSMESRYEFAQAFITTENSGFSDIIKLCGKYTREGSWYQDDLEAVYSGVSNEWLLEEIDISDHAGQKIILGFKTGTSNNSNFDGIYLDDIRVWTDSPEVPFTYPQANDDECFIYGFPYDCTSWMNACNNFDYSTNNLNLLEIDVINNDSIASSNVIIDIISQYDTLFNYNINNDNIIEVIPPIFFQDVMINIGQLENCGADAGIYFYTTFFTYSICDTLNNCDTAEVEFDVSTGVISTDIYEFENEIKCFPNPIKDIVTISSYNEIINSIQVYDLNSKLLIKKQVDQSALNLDLSNYDSGVYYLNVELQSGKRLSKEIIKL